MTIVNNTRQEVTKNNKNDIIIANFLVKELHNDLMTNKSLHMTSFMAGSRLGNKISTADKK